MGIIENDTPYPRCSGRKHRTYTKKIQTNRFNICFPAFNLNIYALGRKCADPKFEEVIVRVAPAMSNE